jgi:integrase
MQGHIRKRVHRTKDGRQTVRWYVVVDLDRGPDGKRRQKWHGGYATRREAEAARVEILHEMSAGTYVEPTTTTLEEWVEGTWLPLTERRVKPSTLDSYRRNLRNHVLPRLGRRQLRQVNAAMLNRLYVELESSGNLRTGMGLDPKTVRYVHTIIHKLLADAVDLGLVKTNAADKATPPEPKARAPQGPKAWTAAELAAFIRLVEGHRLEAAWNLAAFTGMRRAEILGLRWHDIDLVNRRLEIRQTLVAVGYEVVTSSPKTHQARAVDIDEVTCELLRKHRTRRDRDRAQWGAGYQDGDLVFSREDGSPIHPHTLSQAFERIVKRSGLPKISLHGLRHTHATLGLAFGVHEKVVAERLGHQSVAFTMKQYAHVLPGMQAEAADLIATAVRAQMDEEESGST